MLAQVLTSLSAQLATLLGTRLELLGLEALQFRNRVLGRLALLLAAALSLFLAILVASLTVVLYFWPTGYRYWALLILTLGYAVLGAGLACWLVRLVRHDPGPFAVTAEVLREDVRALAGDRAAQGAESAGSHASADASAGRAGHD